MGTIERTENGIRIVFTHEEVHGSALDPAKEYCLHTIKKGVWVLTENEPATKEKPTGQKEGISAEKVDARIFSLLEQKSLSERVEGKFETFLNEAEQARLHQLLAENRVEKFRLNDTYRKAVYRAVPPKKKKESERITAPEKEREEYSLEKDGFLVVRNEERAKKLSQELEKDIKENRVRGTKSFDGNFYIIETALLEKYREPACRALKKNSPRALSEIAQKIGVSAMLTRIICEFLKEDGDIIEKRKELYQVV